MHFRWTISLREADLTSVLAELLKSQSTLSLGPMYCLRPRVILLRFLKRAYKSLTDSACLKYIQAAYIEVRREPSSGVMVPL